MKVLLINGSPKREGCTNRALEEVAIELEKNNISSETIWLGTSPMQDCIACGKCMSTGKCIFDDIVNETAIKLAEADGIVVGSPVYYGGPNGRVCSFLDRLCYSAGSRLDGMAAACVVSCRRGGASAAYDRINNYFGMTNCMIPASQYWNQVHGNTPQEVEQDKEGLQTMRTLADNMAWIIKSKIAAKDAGVEYPVRGKSERTNFIRNI